MSTTATQMFHNHASHPDAFPRFTDRQLASVERRATCREFADGELLFEQGDRAIGFFVVKSGRVRVLQRTAEGDHDFAEHTPGEFTGDLSMLTRAAAIGAAVADGPVQTLHLDADMLQQVIAEEPEVSEIILRAMLLRRSILEQAGYEAVKLIGSRWCKLNGELKDFLARNRVLFRWIDPETDDEVDHILQHLGVRPADLPVIVGCPFGVLRQPSIYDVADALGLNTKVDRKLYDVAVVGAGPSGLAAAVYAASEGLATLVIEGAAPGGQAATSSRIENYLGFPTGVSGSELAQRAVTQAQKFGAAIVSPCTVAAIECEGDYKRLSLSNGDEALAKTVVIATGANYRRLAAATGLDDYAGSAVFYAATASEARLCEGCDIAVVGGGNSAGQAAVFLAQHARHVYMLIRRDSLAETMSRYLIDRIERAENITLRPRTEIAGTRGASKLEGLDLTCEAGDRSIPATAVFVMIGAAPCTDWLGDCVGLDERGFAVTGLAAAEHPAAAAHWTRERQPFLLETTRPGIFAVGDVRSGSVKRVASGVGEGSMAVKFVHEVLAEV